MAELNNLQKYFETDIKNDIFNDIKNDQFKENSIKPEIQNVWEIKCDSGLSLTIPAVSVELLSDPIATAINTHCPSEISNRKKHIINSENLTIDDNGIRLLIDAKCYRSAIAITSRLLSNYGQGINQKGQEIKHSIHSLQLWNTRLSLLIKINELEIARKEATPFGQLSNSDIFYDFTEEQSFKIKKGSLASFSFRLLLAYELPLKLNRPKEALQNLKSILSTTRKIHQFFRNSQATAEAEFWKNREIRVLCHIISTATHLKNFDLAHQTFENLLRLPDLNENLKYELFSFWGKIYLQCGNIFSAEEKFILIPSDRLDFVINKGLLAVAQNDYNEAIKFFINAYEIEKNNIMVINNLAVCYLYNGKMHDAIQLYEKAIFDDSVNNLHETILLNCATLYELESNESKKKKIELLKIVSQNLSDLEMMNIDTCLKL